MAITVVIEPTVHAVSGLETQFTASGPFVLYGDGFAEGERCSLERLGPSGTYIKARNAKGMIKVSAYPNMVYVDAPGSYRLRKGHTSIAASVGIQSSHTVELLINTDEYLELKLPEIFTATNGIWYDPQDLSTLFQDAQGTLPVYKPGTGQVDPPVGLALDKSLGLELGPELWDGTLTVEDSGPPSSAGEYVPTTGELKNNAAGQYIYRPVFKGNPIDKGFYLVSVAFSGNVDVLYGIGLARAFDINVFENASVRGSDIRDNGNTYTYIGYAGGYSRHLSILCDGTTTWDGLFIESISIREIKGYHAYQETTTARPTLSGRYNLLTATETLGTQSVTTAATNYTLRFEGEGSIALSGAATGTYSAGTHTITCTAGTLTLTVDGSVTKADLRVKAYLDGSNLPAYQEVTDANTYDTDGFPLYLKRDRVDDDLIVQAPAISGVSAWGAAEGSLVGKVNIEAGEYHPLGAITEGLTTCTQLIHIGGELSVAETAVLEQIVASKSGTTYNVTTDDPVVFQFDLTSVSTFDFTLQTSRGLPVLVDWGDGNTTAYAGTTDQTATKTYAASGNYTVKVYGVLTKFDTIDAGMSGTLSLPSGMTTFRCAGSNTLSGTLSLPDGMTSFRCVGSNTLGGTLSLPSGMKQFVFYGSNTLSGTLSLPSGMEYFVCQGSNTLSGTLSLPSGMRTFICQGSNTLSGTLSLPSKIAYFACAGSNTLSGTLSLPSGMTYFYCGGSNTLSGMLSLPSEMTSFSCEGSNTLSGYTPSEKASNQRRFRLTGQNTLSATDVDNILIDYDAAGGTWAEPKEITIQGNAEDRTSDSDAAYDSLAIKLDTLNVD